MDYSRNIHGKKVTFVIQIGFEPRKFSDFSHPNIVSKIKSAHGSTQLNYFNEFTSAYVKNRIKELRNSMKMEEG